MIALGFKSVFTVSEVVEVLSKEYAFKFDKSAQLGMIAPIWTGTPLPKHGWTSFHLTLSPTTDAQVLTPCLDDIQPTLLLFLRRLRCIQLHFRGQDRIFRLCESADGLVHLEASGDISKGYLIVKHQAVTCPSEEKRSGIVRSEVVLAFPMDASGSASIKDQAVYAFLPLRSFGLSVRSFKAALCATRAHFVIVYCPSRFLGCIKSRRHLNWSTVEYRSA